MGLTGNFRDYREFPSSPLSLLIRLILSLIPPSPRNFPSKNLSCRINKYLAWKIRQMAILATTSGGLVRASSKK